MKVLNEDTIGTLALASLIVSVSLLGTGLWVTFKAQDKLSEANDVYRSATAYYQAAQDEYRKAANSTPSASWPKVINNIIPDYGCTCTKVSCQCDVYECKLQEKR